MITSRSVQQNLRLHPVIRTIGLYFLISIIQIHQWEKEIDDGS